jgi:periplasmic protein TonB
MNEHDERPEPAAAISSETRLVWTERVTRWLIRRAARSAPEALAGRLEEEWLADLGARPSAWSRARFAIGCCWATKVIALEHAGATAALAGHAAGAKVAIPLLPGNLHPLSRRSVTLALVVGLHIALFYGLMIGLNLNIKKLLTPPLQNLRLPQPHPNVLPPPIPPPTLTPSRIDPKIPEFPPTEVLDETTRLVGEPPRDPPPLRTETSSHEVIRVQGGPGSAFPNPDDFYPSAAKRLEEQGSAIVRVCVDANGRLMSDPTTVQSSGNARLDAGALQLAKAGSGHYRASTEDGRPVNACYPFRVRFQLRN